eukprot:gene1911-1156_t
MIPMPLRISGVYSGVGGVMNLRAAFAGSNPTGAEKRFPRWRACGGARLVRA